MTNKEAIEEIKNASDREVAYGDVERHFDDVMKRVEAFKMAISALEKQEGEGGLTMAEYIEREAAIKIVNTPNYNKHDMLFALKTIPAASAADVEEVRHGRWLPDYDYTEYDFDGSTPLSEPRKFQDGWQCSLCGQYEPSETNYCPNCGAKMDGGADDAAD